VSPAAAKLSKSTPSPSPETVPSQEYVHVERRIGFAFAAHHLLVDRLRLVALGHVGRAGSFGQVGRRLLAHFAALVPRRLEQRVLFQFLGDEAFDLEVGQRQQADRLLQLRRHHQRLRLAKLKAWTQAHG
jgi:hypothetical protein